MICDVCGSHGFRNETVSETFRIGDEVFVVEGVPAEVCERCGEATFSAAVAEQVRRLVREPHEAVRILRAEVLDFRAA